MIQIKKFKNYKLRLSELDFKKVLSKYNKLLINKVKYLEDKIKQIIKEQIEKSKLNKII